MTFLAFPFLLWAALRFEARGSTLATALLFTVSVQSTVGQATTFNVWLPFAGQQAPAPG